MKEPFFLLAFVAPGQVRGGSCFIVHGNHGYYLVTNIHTLRNTNQETFPLPVNAGHFPLLVANSQNQIRINPLPVTNHMGQIIYRVLIVPTQQPRILDLAVLPLGQELPQEFRDNAYSFEEMDRRTGADHTQENNRQLTMIGFPTDVYTYANNQFLAHLDTMDITYTGDYQHAPEFMFTFEWESDRNGVGFSGGPIVRVSDNETKVVGITQGAGLAIYSNCICELIENYEDNLHL